MLSKLKLRLSWFKRKLAKPLRKYVAVTVLTILAAALLAWVSYLRFVLGSGWAVWTGFGEYTDKEGTYYRAKTLWDWMELLIVPTALAIIAYFFNKSERMNAQKLAETQARHE